MMAVILYLFLLIGANSAWAVGFIPDLKKMQIDYVNVNLDQPVLEHYSSVKEGSITSYRGPGELINSTVSVMSENSFGAGFVLDLESARRLLPDVDISFIIENTLVITNFHVVESGEVQTVLFAPKGNIDLDNCTVAIAEIISTVPEKDLALLVVKERPPHVSGLSFARKNIVQVGDVVEAVGHPSGQFWTYTRGYVSQIRENHEWQYNDLSTLNANVIQTQTPISTGNSGGPLFAANGEVVGINSFVNDSGQNLNFAVASTEFIHLSKALVDATHKISIRSSLDWNDINEAFKDNYKLINQDKGDDHYYKIFENKDNGFVFMAIYEDKVSAPVIVFYNEIDGEDHTFMLDAGHENPNSIFKVTITNSDEEVVFEGWDHDGDFIIDYAI